LARLGRRELVAGDQLRQANHGEEFVPVQLRSKPLPSGVATA
jgi:hypothetical protein